VGLAGTDYLPLESGLSVQAGGYSLQVVGMRGKKLESTEIVAEEEIRTLETKRC
jgi:hypothetical protein